MLTWSDRITYLPPTTTPQVDKNKRSLDTDYKESKRGTNQMKRLITTAVMALFMGISAQASTVTFDLAGGFANLTPLLFTGTGSDLGVNFTSELELSALAGSTLLRDLSGVGVDTTGTANNFEINVGEGFDAASATVTSSLGGTAVFSHFTSITFSEVDAGDTGTINGDAISAGVFDLTAASFSDTNPTTLEIRGTGENGTSPGFQVSQVVAEFNVVPTATGVAGVPEPSSFAALLLIGGCAVSRRRRRK